MMCMEETIEQLGSKNTAIIYLAAGAHNDEKHLLSIIAIENSHSCLNVSLFGTS